MWSEPRSSNAPTKTIPTRKPDVMAPPCLSPAPLMWGQGGAMTSDLRVTIVFVGAVVKIT